MRKLKRTNFTQLDIDRLVDVVSSLPLCGAMRKFQSDVPLQGCKQIGTRSDGHTVFCDKHGKGWPELPYARAVRNL
jgi:hypothetical protein